MGLGQASRRCADAEVLLSPSTFQMPSSFKLWGILSPATSSDPAPFFDASRCSRKLRLRRYLLCTSAVLSLFSPSNAEDGRAQPRSRSAAVARRHRRQGDRVQERGSQAPDEALASGISPMLNQASIAAPQAERGHGSDERCSRAGHERGGVGPFPSLRPDRFMRSAVRKSPPPQESRSWVLSG